MSIILLVLVATIFVNGVSTLQNLETTNRVVNGNNDIIAVPNVLCKINVDDYATNFLPMCVLSKTSEQEIFWGHTNRLPNEHNVRTHTKVEMNSHLRVLNLMFTKPTIIFKNAVTVLVAIIFGDGVPTLQNLEATSENNIIAGSNVFCKSNDDDYALKFLPMCVLSKTPEQEFYWGHTTRLPYEHNERTHTKVLMNSHSRVLNLMFIKSSTNLQECILVDLYI